VQCDEIWAFCYAKEKNVTDAMPKDAGDVWTWVGLDADSKLAIGWLVGDRDADTAKVFMQDIAARLAKKVYFYFLCRTPKPYHAYAHETFYTLNKCFQ